MTLQVPAVRPSLRTRVGRLAHDSLEGLALALRRVLDRGLGLARIAGRWAGQRLRDPLGRRRHLPAPLPEFHEHFDSRAACEAFFSARPQLSDRATIDACAAHIGIAGIDFLGRRVAGCRIEPAFGRNYREGLRWRGLNARKRALVHCLFSELDSAERAVVYAPEALGPLARFLGARLPGFVGSEYFTDERSRARHPDVRHEDLACLSFEDATVDRAVIGDVFEHVEDLPQVLRELHRVLTPGGIVYSTFPFARGSDDHLVRARRVGGEIEYLCEPEYHGDPVRPGGVLVFQVPGWRILDDCRAAGFARAEMVFLGSCRLGVIASDLAGIMVLRAEK